MAQFARQSVPRFASSTTSTQETGDNIGVMTQITIPAGATSVLISCITTGPVYIDPVGATTTAGIILGSGAGDIPHIFIELGGGATISMEAASSDKANFIWMYD